MKRYDMEIDEYVASPESVVTRIGCFPVESPDGDWVKWDEADERIRELEETNKELQEQLDATQEKVDELKNSLHDIKFTVGQHI
jgi:peptidoglycan hydrolase CwlO-like protein